jgi:hypothetical protein
MVCSENKSLFSLNLLAKILTMFKRAKFNDYKTQYTTYYFV